MVYSRLISSNLFFKSTDVAAHLMFLECEPGFFSYAIGVALRFLEIFPAHADLIFLDFT